MEDDLQARGYNVRVQRKIRKILVKIPVNWVGLANRNPNQHVIVKPFPFFFQGQQLRNIITTESQAFYKYFIKDRISMPRGLLFWCQELTLTDDQISCSLKFPSSCTPNIFRRVFQYKISTNILPTQEYLFRYQVTDSNICTSSIYRAPDSP